MSFVQNNFWLILIALTAAFMLIWPSISRRVSGVGEVQPAEAVQKINREDALVLDVREDNEYRAGHIPNARHIPLSQLAGRLSELEQFKGRPIVVNCRSGARSASACGTLSKAGFTVFNLRGGIIAWEQASLPVEK